jgi:flagellar basal body-associated protein FliL
MSDKAEKKSDGAGHDKKDGAKGGGLMGSTPILLGIVMLIEAVVLFAGFKFLGAGGPKNANGADLTTASATTQPDGGKSDADDKTPVEVPVLDIKAPNRQNGGTFIYDVSILVSVKPEFQQKTEDVLKSHEALITDRIRTIIAQTDPDKLGGGSEPGLETLKRQVKYQLDEIVGDGIIDEVLVPRCIPYRADF